MSGLWSHGSRVKPSFPVQKYPSWNVYSYNAQIPGSPRDGPIYTCFSCWAVMWPLCSQMFQIIQSSLVVLPGKALVPLIASCPDIPYDSLDHSMQRPCKNRERVNISFLLLPHFRWEHLPSNLMIAFPLMSLVLGRVLVPAGQPSNWAFYLKKAHTQHLLGNHC